MSIDDLFDRDKLAHTTVSAVADLAQAKLLEPLAGGAIAKVVNALGLDVPKCQLVRDCQFPNGQYEDVFLFMPGGEGIHIRVYALDVAQAEEHKARLDI